MRRTAIALALALAACLLLPACGGDDGPTTADYKQRFDPVNQQIKDLGSSVADAVSNAEGKTNSVLEKQFAELSAQTRSLAQDVVKLEPPGDAISQKQDALVDALREAGRDLQSISAAAAAGNAERAKAATTKLATATSEAIKSSREAIEQQLAAE